MNRKLLIFTAFITTALFVGCTLRPTTTSHLDNIDAQENTASDGSTNAVNDSENTSEPSTIGTNNLEQNNSSNSSDENNSQNNSDSDENLENTTIITPLEPITITGTTTDAYHDLISDLSGIQLNLDVTDSRLNAVKNYLYEYDFNFTLQEIGQITQPDSLYVLCNKLNQLPQDFVPTDLREVNVNFTFTEASEKKMLRNDAATALEELFAAAKEAGYDLFALSGYRSYNTQINNYTSRVNSLGQEGADKISARPGHSEHQSGLAMDITSESASFRLIESFGDTPEGLWVKENAHRFGFIIRYQQTTTSITGYSYEPWHLRYITSDVASYLYDNNITLEELYATLLGK